MVASLLPWITASISFGLGSQSESISGVHRQTELWIFGPGDGWLTIVAGSAMIAMAFAYERLGTWTAMTRTTAGVLLVGTTFVWLLLVHSHLSTRFNSANAFLGGADPFADEPSFTLQFGFGFWLAGLGTAAAAVGVVLGRADGPANRGHTTAAF